MSSDDLKARGNIAFGIGNYDEAVRLYSEGISLDANNHILYTNRAAAHLEAGRFEEAIVDAETALQKNPTFMKAYYRKASALRSLGKLRDSYETWKVAKIRCEQSSILDTQLEMARQKWIVVMRESVIENSEDFLDKYSVLSDMRERLSILAHLWNESNNLERKQHFCCFLRLIGGSTASIDAAKIDESRMIDMPMENYSDLPSTRIPHWITYFNGLDSATKTEVLSGIWNKLTATEQNAVVRDLKTFLYDAV